MVTVPFDTTFETTLGFWGKRAFVEEKDLDASVLFFVRNHVFDFKETEIQVVGDIMKNDDYLKKCDLFL